MNHTAYEDYLRNRITELRLEKNISEHKMSLDLGKSGSYIRSITSGAALPSVKELFNIIDYLEMEPSDFFRTFTERRTLFSNIMEKIRLLDEDTLDKVDTFITWIS